MPAGGGAGANGARTPRLASDCDLEGLELSPAEGFLLSRIDGHTPQALLREVGGLPPDDVDRCIERWVEAGLVVFVGSGPPAGSGEADVGFAEVSASPAPTTLAIDPGLEISAEAQQAVLAMHAGLERPYHEILGVEPDADVRTIKRAYFGLSKEFHPDRYFRRQIGPYADVVERVFRRIVEAYELLSDPATRAEVQRDLAAAAETPREPPAAEPSVEASRPRKRRTGPRPFSPLARVFAQRRAKAKSFFEAGMAAYAEGRWLEAAGSVRLAIAFDSRNAVYKSRFVDVRQKVAEVRFEQLTKEADGAMTFRDRADALKLYEEALHYKPFDAQVNHTAAWLVADDPRRAKEYAVRACEVEPDQPEYRKTLGMIYKAAGLKANARRELQSALRLNPKDDEARAELKSL
jgi:curved DNA-binding protein CbpA